MTIDSVLKAVETNNPSLKIYDEQVKQQDALIESASAWKAPMLGIGSFMTPYNNFSRANNLRDGSFMLTAEQEILNKSKKNSEAAYLAAQSVITLAAKNNNLNELKALARSFFYDVVVEQKKVELINKNIEILSNLKKLANIRYTYNKADLDQIYSLDAKIYDGQNKLTAALANIHIGKIRLNVLMNKPYNAPISIDTSLNIVHFVIKDINSMVANRSIVKQADAQIQSVNLAKKMIANEAKPDFNISFNHMLAYNNQMPNQFSLMAGVSIPIAPWAAKGYKSKLKANEFESNALRLERDNLVNQLNGMIKSSEQHLLHLNSELETYKNKILPSLNKSYEVMMLNYQENKKELSEVLTGWKDLNDAQIDYLNLYNEYFKMYVEYEKNVER
ncbi:TolC family protein [Pedobacter alpinus]|uniref:TolC family protein n=2 Tax=Pedobacter alpinus TaxID=1590643 RepID=A0ABW5TTK2_9SPHI